MLCLKINIFIIVFQILWHYGISSTKIILYDKLAFSNFCLKIASKHKPKHVGKYNQYVKNVVTGGCFDCSCVTIGRGARFVVGISQYL